jgi:glutamate synthase (NADPH/NADH) large chain
VINVNRTVGAMLSGEVARRYGHAGLPDNTINIAFKGVAGQSFGAFLAHGVTLDLVGDANDYVGKGLSGGRVIVRQPAHVEREAAENIIVGNTVLYGAIAGKRSSTAWAANALPCATRAPSRWSKARATMAANT